MRGGHERSPRFFSPALGTFLTYFPGLVYVGDVIRSTDSFRETVTEVRFDGSFYTETEPYELLNETEELSD